MNNKNNTQDNNSKENYTKDREAQSDYNYQETPKKSSSFIKFIKKNPVIFTAFLGILSVIFVFFWKDIQMQRQTKELTLLASTRLAEKNQEMLKLFTKPLVWSIRSEMLRGNLEQVDMLTTDMVKEKNFQFLYLIEPTGQIIISTDKKREGQQFEENFNQEIMNVEQTVVFIQEGNLLITATPVMGYDSRLATLVVGYTAE